MRTWLGVEVSTRRPPRRMANTRLFSGSQIPTVVFSVLFLGSVHALNSTNKGCRVAFSFFFKFCWDSLNSTNQPRISPPFFSSPSFWGSVSPFNSTNQQRMPIRVFFFLQVLLGHFKLNQPTKGCRFLFLSPEIHASEDRLRAIHLRKQGWAKAEIANDIGRSERFVARWWQLEPLAVPRPPGVHQYLAHSMIGDQKVDRTDAGSTVGNILRLCPLLRG